VMANATRLATINATRAERRSFLKFMGQAFWKPHLILYVAPKRVIDFSRIEKFVSLQAVCCFYLPIIIILPLGWQLIRWINRPDLTVIHWCDHRLNSLGGMSYNGHPIRIIERISNSSDPLTLEHLML
jgi:hypothetical protein